MRPLRRSSLTRPLPKASLAKNPNPAFRKVFLDDYVEVASKLTDAPGIYHRYLAYSVAGTILGHQVYLLEGRDYVYPNLWAVIVGGSSAFRKSTSLNIAKDMIKDLCKERIYPDEFTQEKLIEVLRAQPQGVFFHYEFAQFMGLMNKEYNMGMKAFLTALYDCPYEYHRTTRGAKDIITIQQPCISMICATTSQWLVKNLQESDILEA